MNFFTMQKAISTFKIYERRTVNKTKIQFKNFFALIILSIFLGEFHLIENALKYPFAKCSSFFFQKRKTINTFKPNKNIFICNFSVFHFPFSLFSLYEVISIMRSFTYLSVFFCFFSTLLWIVYCAPVPPFSSHKYRNTKVLHYFVFFIEGSVVLFQTIIKIGAIRTYLSSWFSFFFSHWQNNFPTNKTKLWKNERRAEVWNIHLEELLLFFAPPPPTHSFGFYNFCVFVREKWTSFSYGRILANLHHFFSPPFLSSSCEQNNFQHPAVFFFKF